MHFFKKFSQRVVFKGKFLSKKLAKSSKDFEFKPETGKLMFWYKAIGIPAFIIGALLVGKNYQDGPPTVNERSVALINKAENSLANKPKKAEKLAVKAQQSSFKAGDVANQIQSILLRVDALFEQNKRPEAMALLNDLTKRTSDPLHIVNSSPRNSAYYNLGLARILLKNKLVPQALPKLNLAYTNFAAANMHLEGAEEVLKIARNLQENGQMTDAATVYNITALFFKKHGYNVRAASFYELTGDLMRQKDGRGNNETSYLMYVNAINILSPIRQKTNALEAQLNRAVKKLQSLPASATENLYD